MATKAKAMRKETLRGVFLDTIGTAVSIMLVGMAIVICCVMIIGNRQIAIAEQTYGIKIEKKYVPTVRKSVKEQVNEYIDSLPVPPRVYTSIHEESTLMAKAETKKMVKKLDEAILKNPTLGMKVVGMTPLIYAMNTSAYCPCIPCCGKTDGQTASGPKARQWYTVAAGETYNFGTIIYIPTLSDKPNGGWFVVQDRGGAISDDKLDIYFDSHLEALQYGRRQAECWIFKK